MSELRGSILGSAVKRREDPRLITGAGRYVDDRPLAGVLHAAFVRSTLAHARMLGVDTSAAASSAGVAGVFTAADLALPGRLAFPVEKVFSRPPLADGTVRFVGELIAVVVAETRAQAADAAQAVQVDYQALPVVTDMLEGLKEGATHLFPDKGSNVGFTVAFGGDQGDVLEGAEVTIRARFLNNRVAAFPMEGNAIHAEPDGRGGLACWVSTQAPHAIRDALAEDLGLEESQVRVVAADVGGGFGAKIICYPEFTVVAACAKRLERPVRWIETRSENLVAMTQGRGQVQDVELGATRDGKLTGLRLRVVSDLGAYPGLGAYMAFLTGQMSSGVYAIPKIDYASQGVATNTTPMSAYRGAGRPEAASMIERAMDMLAVELGMDPVALRRKNLIGRDSFPYTTAAGATYDVGDYERALTAALEAAGYQRLRQEQAERRARGDRMLLGIGLSVYVEVTAVGSPTEFGAAEMKPDGSVQIRAGTHSHGQGHETSLAQIAAGVLHVPMERITVVEGDTALVPRGDGTAGSRSMQLGGSAVHEASLLLREKARELAAHLLEADPDDVVFQGGRFAIAGVPSRALGWEELAVAAADRDRLPEGMEPGLSAVADFVQGDTTYPFGTHIAVVEIDSETGAVSYLRHVAVDDCGTIINPMIARGQVHGGIAQGAAQALYEEVLYDAEGNPLTSSLIDYGAPSANELPAFETGHTVTPTPLNPLGAKGIGESGTIGSTPAVQNAVVDALSHLGIRHLDMPATPDRVWKAIQQAQRS